MLQSSRVKTGDRPHLESLLKLLFPRAGGFNSNEKFWNGFYRLGSSSTADATAPATPTTAATTMAKLVRIYRYIASDTKEDDAKIKNFYDGSRKSAYQTPNLGQAGASGTTSYISASGLSSMLSAATFQEIKGKIDSDLMFCLVDSPAIDFKLRNADKVEIFTNYTPAVSISQAVPYLDVKFLSRRNITNVVGQSNIKSRNVGFMSQLHFLMGSEEISDKEKPSANALIYDASNYTLKTSQVEGRTSQDVAIAAQRGNDEKAEAASKRFTKPAASKSAEKAKKNEQNKDEKTPGIIDVKKDEGTFVTGMEMFTSPQTLINLDYNQETNPRYNAIINPTVPFATIVGLTITMVPSYDVFCFKTATMVLKVFDRSRMVEIADFLNPQLYSSATVLLTYGWRAPQQPVSNDANENPYHTFINNNMLMSESYGIQNSSISIDNSGVVTVTLQLTTKGGAELNDVTPTGASLVFKKEQNLLTQKLESLKKAAEQLKIPDLSKSAKDVRGSVVLSAALSATFPELESQALAQEINALTTALTTAAGKDPKSTSGGSQAQQKIDNFRQLVNQVYATPTANKGQQRPQGKYALLSDLEIAAKKVTSSRFDGLQDGTDLFSYKSGNRVGEEQKRIVTDEIYKKFPKGDTATNGYSFGKVFFKYFSTACTGLNDNDQPLIDEYQVFFYNLNENAGPVAGLNIAEFPIEINSLENAYTKRITEKKGENMTLMNFLEIIRESQFSSVRHPAFGFSDLYEIKDGKEFELKKGQDPEFLNRTLRANPGTGEAFAQPTLDFYVESGFSGGDNNGDLLSSFEYTSEIRTTNGQRKRSGLKSIVRIHIFDRAATPHTEATRILNASNGVYVKQIGKFKTTTQPAPPKNENEKKVQAAALAAREGQLVAVREQRNADVAASLKNITDTKALNKLTENTGVRFEFVKLTDENGKPSFQLVKRAISELVPTIIVGAEGSMITNVSYSSNMDSALTTMMIMSNGENSGDPSQVNGAGLGSLPLRVIPGQLTMSMMGCPLLEYMQQFFVDLGTGTTLDNLYNVIGITHKFDPGKFSTEVKFGFSDAYGKFEGSQAIVNEADAIVSAIEAALPPSN